MEDAFFLAVAASSVERPLIPDVRFDFGTYSDANALEDFRFTCSQLQRLTGVMQIPNVFITGAGDRLLGEEALAMLCYRMSYPGKLSKIRKQFGRSDASCSRIITDLYCWLDKEWKDTLYFNDRVFIERHADYIQAVTTKTAGIVDGVSMFIDGTKGFICRPGKRRRRFRAMQGALDAIPVDDRENLQKVCYSGHKRRHCLNYQGVCTPDGRLHDSTMLRDSMLFPYLENHSVVQEQAVLMYGDPAYGIDAMLCSPFHDAQMGSAEKRFNELMSKNRVSIEWMFGILKSKWAFIDWNKKHKILLTPVARMVRVAMLLTNAMTCVHEGNQISDHFDCAPPTLEEYFRKPMETNRLLPSD
ncbi:hypothetical protein PHMEG_00014915 [Phytophthora megakarya]|uniref:DDE Tnp4 domain-containing protein n=1 Tax=Phytophthora megakarya TaxID=4795 RepID=A0A225W2L4_9STRA|nr:hypothetical protein PHMEG_00014915 [Phytophthora megakarya]